MEETQHAQNLRNALRNAIPAGPRVNQLTRPNVNQLTRPNWYDQTPLQAACFDGRVQVVRALIEEEDADVHWTDSLGRTALYVVLFHSNPDNVTETEAMVRLLLDKDANPNVFDSETGATPLHYAKSAVVAQLLLGAGASVQTLDRSGSTPLRNACREWRFEVVEALLNALGADAENAIHSPNPWSSLFQSATRGNSEQNRLLFRILYPFTADTAVLFAVKDQHVSEDFIRFIVEDFSPDMNARTAEGDSPLHLASTPGIMRILLQEGSAREARNNNNETPLIKWASQKRLEMIRVLTAAGADLTAVDNGGFTALDRARMPNVPRERLSDQLVMGNGGNFWDGRRGNQVEEGHDRVVFLDDRGGIAGGLVGHRAGQQPHRYHAVASHLLQQYANVLFAGQGLLSLHHVFQASTYSYIAAAGDDAGDDPPPNPRRMNTSLGLLQMDQVADLLQFLNRNANANTNTNHMIRRRDANGSVPLHYACQNRAPYEILCLLLRLDAIADGGVAGQEAVVLPTPRCRDHQGILPIHALVATNPAVEAVALLLKKHPESASLRALNGDYPLMVACESSASVDVIFELLVSNPRLVRR